MASIGGYRTFRGPRGAGVTGVNRLIPYLVIFVSVYYFTASPTLARTATFSSKLTDLKLWKSTIVAGHGNQAPPLQ